MIRLSLNNRNGSKATGVSRFGWSLTASLVYTLCQWGILVAITRLGNIEMLGQFMLANAFTAPIFMLSGMQSRLLVSTDFSHRHPLGDYLNLQVAAGLVALGAAEIVGKLSGYSDGTLAVIRVVGLAKALECISEVFLGGLQRKDRLDQVSLAIAAKAVLALGVIVLLMQTGWSIAAVCFGIALSWLAVMATIEIPYTLRHIPRSELTVRWDWRRLRPLSWALLPMGIVVSINSFTLNVPRYALADSSGYEALGVFGALAYFVNGLQLVGRVIGQSSITEIAERYAAIDLPAYLKLLKWTTGLSFLIGFSSVAVAAVAGGRFLEFIYGPGFGKHTPILCLVLFGGTLLLAANVMQQAVTAAQMRTVQVVLHTISLVAVIVASGILVPRYGLAGAAWASVIGAAALLSGFLYLAIRSIAAIGDSRTDLEPELCRPQ